MGENLGVDEQYQILAELWERIQWLLPPPKKKKNKDESGRPRKDDRKAANAIFYVLRTVCQWEALPESLGAASTFYDRFQEWRRAGVFQHRWREGFMEYDVKKGLDWKRQATEDAIIKASLGRKSTGANSTDGAKSGTRRSLLVEAD